MIHRKRTAREEFRISHNLLKDEWLDKSPKDGFEKYLAEKYERSVNSEASESRDEILVRLRVLEALLYKD